MSRIIFINPNYPEQPASGIYRWFYVNKEGHEVTFYIGKTKNSSLARGISEAQGKYLSSDKGKTFDTDFIVGTAIKFLKENGYDCLWQHLSDDPDKEKAFCENYKPILQEEDGDIKRNLKISGTTERLKELILQEIKETQ